MKKLFLQFKQIFLAGGHPLINLLALLTAILAGFAFWELGFRKGKDLGGNRLAETFSNVSSPVQSVRAKVVERQYYPEDRGGYRGRVTPEQFVLIYRNTDGGVFTIKDPELWAKAEKGDSIIVYYRYESRLGEDELIFLDLQPFTSPAPETAWRPVTQ